jgi:hypothetical protein
MKAQIVLVNFVQMKKKLGNMIHFTSKTKICRPMGILDPHWKDSHKRSFPHQVMHELWIR